MQFLEIPQFYVFALISDHQSTLLKVRQVEVVDKNKEIKDGEIPTFVVLLAPISFMIVGVGFWVILSKILKTIRNKNGTSNIDRLKQYPCKNCKFFDDNNYIKCAVKPSLVLTKQALDCPEYQPDDKKTLV